MEDHPLSAVRDCLFNIFAASLHNWRASGYLNLKGFFNIHMKAKCYARDVFTGIDAEWQTSVQNSRILRRS
jgi:hypothetical protein